MRKIFISVDLNVILHIFVTTEGTLKTRVCFIRVQNVKINFQFFSDSSAIVLASPHFLDSEADSIASNICFFYRQEDIEVREAVLPIPEQVTPETSSV